MDKADDMDGRNASKWSLHLTCLLVHLGFGELMHPEQTLGGKKTVTKDNKSDSHYEKDTKNMEAFGDSRKPKKRRVKRQTTNDKCDAGEASLGGDQVDKAMAYIVWKLEKNAEIKRKTPSQREKIENFKKESLCFLASQNRNQDTPQSRMTVIATVRCCCRCGFSSQNAELNFCTVCNGEIK